MLMLLPACPFTRYYAAAAAAIGAAADIFDTCCHASAACARLPLRCRRLPCSCFRAIAILPLALVLRATPRRRLPALMLTPL